MSTLQKKAVHIFREREICDQSSTGMEIPVPFLMLSISCDFRFLCAYL